MLNKPKNKMTGEELNILQLKIESKLERLEKDIADLKEATKPIPPDAAYGRVSRMDAINNKSVNEAALRQAIEQEKNLLIALRDIDEKDFGKCRKCKGEIPFKRMLVMPESTHCVKCQVKR